MAIATTKTAPFMEKMTIEEQYDAVFSPIVRSNMIESWQKNWKKWFCTTGTTQENLTPGKLKCKFLLKFKLICLR